jgi:hypothetical protein|tara:strand:- start:1535 stop:1696 length:162 start_codon:yes stop_codon:yes gene_type:complete
MLIAIGTILLLAFVENLYFGWNLIPSSKSEIIADACILLSAIIVTSFGLTHIT